MVPAPSLPPVAESTEIDDAPAEIFPLESVLKSPAPYPFNSTTRLYLSCMIGLPAALLNNISGLPLSVAPMYAGPSLDLYQTPTAYHSLFATKFDLPPVVSIVWAVRLPDTCG